jgi:hypothetical protein
MSAVALAVQCGKIADHTCAEETLAEKARKLKHEWAMLMARQTPPPMVYKEMHALEDEEKTLRRRMIDFLLTI